MISRRGPTLSALVLALVLSTPVFIVGMSSRKPPGKPALVYSNDVQGDIEPCGCRNNPQGGMLRKSMLLERSPGTEFLQVDAGDLLFPTLEIPEPLAAQSELQAAYLLEAMSTLGHQIVVPGEKDFALGLKVFERLRKKADLEFLAANLAYRNGSRFLDGDRIILMGEGDSKLRIAVLGLVGKDLPWPVELAAQDAIETAKKRVPSLKEKSDLVIVVTHQGVEEDQRLAKEVKGIDIIVGGHTQSFLQQPIAVGTTRIYQSSFRNQYVGVLPLKKPFTGEGHQLVGLDAAFDPGSSRQHPVPGKIEKLVDQFKQEIAKLNLQEEKARLTEAGHEEVAKFQTFPKCSECHTRQFDFWRKTRHADALWPLQQAKQLHNKDCLTCHTLGLGDSEGYSAVQEIAGEMSLTDLTSFLHSMHEAKSLETPVRLTPKAEAQPLKHAYSRLQRVFAPVQCENCHSPGRDHPFSSSYTKTVENRTCLKCHTQERAPAWYTGQGQPDWVKIQEKRKLISCPSGDLN